MQMKGQKMKIIKYFCLSLFLIILIVFSQLNSGLCGEINDMRKMEKISLDAVNKAYGWTKKYSLISRLMNRNDFSKTLIIRVMVTDAIDPAPVFIVAIDKKNKSADVFFSYRDAIIKYDDEIMDLSSKEFLERDIKKFSKIIGKESLIIKESNIKNYVDSFLFLVNGESSLIDSIDEIKYLPDEMKSKLKKDAPNVSPLKYNFKEDNISIVFYTYSYRGYLMKWNLSVSRNGEVISFIAEEFKSINMRY